ncbi:MAG: hypothetical protein WCR36_09155, partial [Bacteroidaceae bacterium]
MCDFISASILQHKMNEAASHHIPFLFAIDYEQKEGLFIEEPSEQSTVKWRVPNKTNFETSPKIKKPSSIVFHPHPESKERYAERFNIVVDNL